MRRGSGAPERIAISTSSSSGSSSVSVYDDQGFLKTLGGVGEGPGHVAWSDDGTTLYAKGAGDGTTLYSKVVSRPPDPSSVMTPFPAAFEPGGGDIIFVAGRIVDDRGVVVDAATGSRQGTLGAHSGPVQAVANGEQLRAFVADEATGSRITAYALDTRTPQGSIEIAVPDSSSGGGQPTSELIAWGDDGLAVSVAGRVLLIDGTFVTPVP